MKRATRGPTRHTYAQHPAPHEHAHASARVHTHTPASGRGTLPWSKPVRMREKVTQTRWALLRCVSSGVAAVMKPQAEADSRMTFSPPTLKGRQEEGDRG